MTAWSRRAASMHDSPSCNSTTSAVQPAHVLFGKPVPTFPGHALVRLGFALCVALWRVLGLILVASQLRGQPRVDVTQLGERVVEHLAPPLQPLDQLHAGLLASLEDQRRDV